MPRKSMRQKIIEYLKKKRETERELKGYPNKNDYRYLF